MMIGMLWFDNDPKASLTEKIERAAKYYLEKHGKKATLVYINQRDLAGGLGPLHGIQVKVSAQVQPNHLWMGEEATQKDVE